ncbi:MAG: ABC transporter permease [Rhodospirillaceae bacterium]|nr:MAG: ABC transporter permease [Rhodospirillaceae bacterium]
MKSGFGAIAVNRQRLLGFLRKEWFQVLRDPSSIIVAVILPVIMLVLFGFGVSLDARQQRVAVVMETSAPEARDFLAALRATPYVVPQVAANRTEAAAALRSGVVKAIIVFADDFGARVNGGGANAAIQVIVDGTDSNTARLLEGYIQGVWAVWLVGREHVDPGSTPTPVNVQFQVWFNAALDSHVSMVPGLIALIMTTIGAFLTALVIAREWERGTMEALLTTPLTRTELLLGKLIPYFMLGMAGMAVSTIFALTVFGLTFAGSYLLLLLSSSVFMLVVLGIGLMASTLTRNQFTASIVALTSSMLPAFLLSGFIFDIRSMVPAVRWVTTVLPARYFVDILKTLFLVGNVWSVILPDLAVLALMAAVLLTITAVATKRNLE